MFVLHLSSLFPCNVYPEKHVYETAVPQLYGPEVGLKLPLVTDGGLPHWQTSAWEGQSIKIFSE